MYKEIENSYSTGDKTQSAYPDKMDLQVGYSRQSSCYKHGQEIHKRKEEINISRSQWSGKQEKAR